MSNAGSNGKPNPAQNQASDSTQQQCIICNLPNEADRKMVQCDGCDRWFHFMCAGVNDSIEDENRSYICVACAVPALSVTSTSSSVREARKQLEMQRLEEEKRLQEKVRDEREKQERILQELTLRMERERGERALAAMLAAEKQHIQQKYDLLHTQLNDDDEGGSVRSRANCGANKVQDWMKQNTVVTLSSNTGCNPTGLTLQDDVTASSIQTTTVAVLASTTATSQAHQVHQPILPTATQELPTVSQSSCVTSLATNHVYSLPQSAHPQMNQQPNSTSILWCYRNPIPAASASAQASTTVTPTTSDDNCMFVISPTTTTTVSHELPGIPNSAMRSIANPSNSQQSLALPSTSISPLQPPIRAVSSTGFGSSYPAFIPSNSGAFVQQNTLPYNGMLPPPEHQSTPTSVPPGRPPLRRMVENLRNPVQHQESAERHVMYAAQHASVNPPVGQYIPSTAVSSQYSISDWHNAYRNPWAAVSNQLPTTFVPQSVPHAIASVGQSQGYQGHVSGHVANQINIPSYYPMPTSVPPTSCVGFNVSGFPVSSVPVKCYARVQSQ